ncbi:hypothetical protein [Hymenobacter sp. YC55]|uniref:hypothetical protein n=1 Tax=Hymenobacter sp. YC55 TaxID=3034019 RepID=UPI0023F63C23|nr:hypothetical protein [Hymenobacter sp. YC55]MDF7813599.1 hypothetical protein [Hymenobacter sp. YC55]
MYADLIRDAAETHIRSGQSDTSAQDLQAVFGKVAEAVETFEGVTRGAIIHHGPGAPDNGLGLDIDAYIDTRNTDLYIKEAGAWTFRLTLRGAPSTVPGPPGKEGPASTVAGPAGKSAYELAVASGYVGTVAQFLASLKGAPGADGEDGTNGTRIRIESFEPTTEVSNFGDLWIHTISAAKYAIYDCLVNAQGDITWRLRFTSPDGTAAPSNSTNGVALTSSGDGTKFLANDGSYKTITVPTTGTGGGTVKSVNNVAPDANGNVTLTIGLGTVKTVNGVAPDANGNVNVAAGSGGGPTVEQDLSSNSPSSVPSVAAVRSATRAAPRTGTIVHLDRDSVYGTITSGTFAVDLSDKVPGSVAQIFLTPSATPPTLDPAVFQSKQTYTAGKNLCYMFCAGGNGKVQYTIQELD